MLHHLLRRPLETDPDRPLLECDGSWTTAAELERLVVVPLDWQYHPLQVGYAVGHSGAAVLCVDHTRAAWLDEAGVLGTVPRVVVVGGGVAAGGRRPFESLCRNSPSGTSSPRCGGRPPRRLSRPRPHASDGSWRATTSGPATSADSASVWPATTGCRRGSSRRSSGSRACL